MVWKWFPWRLKVARVPRMRRADILPAAQAAADWWADQLNQEARRETPSTADGEMGVVRFRYTPEQVQSFRAELARILNTTLRQRLRKRSLNARQVLVKFAYQPDAYLQRAADAAGIRGPLGLPANTIMWVYEGSVLVRLGRNFSTETIYPK